MQEGSTVHDEPLRLTRFSRAAGCGCKIAPAILDTILADTSGFHDPRLLVGSDTRDDAAVHDLQDGTALVGTTDFFAPIVDDPFDFGRVAAANAMSDVYAMGGRPLFALGVLGWPVDRIAPHHAATVLAGGRTICEQAGIPLAGGHSIDSAEPFFGLAVTGRIALRQLKRNHTARPGDLILLTKPIGTGVLATALKRDQLGPNEYDKLIDQLTTLNRIGEHLGELPGVSAMTDVTGFGLFGHLLEMTGDNGKDAAIDWNAVPLMGGTLDLVRAGIYADGALRNWRSYHHRIIDGSALERMMLGADPQTNGGLLIAVDPTQRASVEDLLARSHVACHAIGNFVEGAGRVILV